MATYSSFDQLPIWIEARRLCKNVNEFIIKGDGNKDFRFRDQIKASAGSIMDNIAEGFERSGNNEFIQHLSIAKGESGECRSQL
jgi:four helix bundle protein